MRQCGSEKNGNPVCQNEVEKLLLTGVLESEVFPFILHIFPLQTVKDQVCPLFNLPPLGSTVLPLEENFEVVFIFGVKQKNSSRPKECT